MEKIDFVILWVDGSDLKWQAKRKAYLPGETYDDVRYRDYGSLKYLFRSIEKYGSWVNQVYLITDEQVPEWLNTAHPKLTVVFHDAFIPKQYLPTFNSNVIELNLFRIESLSEKFVLFNDDTFLNNDTQPKDFFQGENILDFGIYNKIAPNEEFAHTLVNDLLIINHHFSKKDSLKKHWKKQFRLRYGRELIKNFLLLPWPDIPGYYNHHFPQPHFKSIFEELYVQEREAFDATFENKTRQMNDINHWLGRYWLLEEGRYLPQHASFGAYLTLSESEKIQKELANGKAKVVCINDETGNAEKFRTWIENVLMAFEEKFPQKSRFER